MLKGFHAAVARAIFEAVGGLGFALGGGYGLQAYGIVDRPSDDIDSYAASMSEGLFVEAENAILGHLAKLGYRAEVVSSDSWFRAVQVASEDGTEAVVVDIGYDYRKNPTRVFANIGPVIDLEDIVVGKLRALSDRRAAKDYIDLDAILADGRYSLSHLQRLLIGVRPELGDSGLAELMRLSQSVPPGDFCAFGLDESEVTALIERLNNAADAALHPTETPGDMDIGRCRRCGRPLRSPESISRGYGQSCATKL